MLAAYRVTTQLLCAGVCRRHSGRVTRCNPAIYAYICFMNGVVCTITTSACYFFFKIDDDNCHDHWLRECTVLYAQRDCEHCLYKRLMSLSLRWDDKRNTRGDYPLNSVPSPHSSLYLFIFSSSFVCSRGTLDKAQGSCPVSLCCHLQL